MDIIANPTLLILPLATAMGAWGGFPEPPAIFRQLSQNKIVQYLMVALLVWQGGGEQDFQMALVVAALIFALKMGLDMVKM